MRLREDVEKMEVYIATVTVLWWPLVYRRLSNVGVPAYLDRMIRSFLANFCSLESVEYTKEMKRTFPPGLYIGFFLLEFYLKRLR